jgi:hypothetical protein
VPFRFVFDEEAARTIKNHRKLKPEAVGNALERLRQENKGRLHPGDVVEDAQNRRSPLHPAFEWEEAVAANKYRLDQARALIRSLQVVEVSNKGDEIGKPRRAFISVHDKIGTSYRGLDEILDSSSLQMAVLQAAERDLKAFQDRYEELSEICDLIRVARERLQERRRKIEGEAEARP